MLALLLSSLWGAVLLVAGAGTVEATTADIGGGVFTSVTGVHDEGHGKLSLYFLFVFVVVCVCVGGGRGQSHLFPGGFFSALERRGK